jgi:hypothetical protein
VDATTDSAKNDPALGGGEQTGSAASSFLMVGLIALVVCVALVGGAVYLLSDSSQLPFNYQGFDTNNGGK